MLKRRVVAVVAGLVLLLAVAGSAGIIADSLDLSLTPQIHACDTSGAGGGC